MRSFFKNISFFISLFTLISVIIITGFMYYHSLEFSHLPAPRLSDSYSYNEKMHFLKNSEIRNPEILAFGSSMTLNNLHSPTVVEHFGTKSLLNISSWGMRMEENYYQLKSLLKVYDPKTLILLTNYSDFFDPEKNIDYKLSNQYITSGEIFELYFHLITFSLTYYIDNFPLAKHVRTSRNDYQYLRYDEFGSINFERNNFNKTDLRWEHHYLDRDTDDDQYMYIDSISTLANNNNIGLIVCQSPHRDGLDVSFNRLQKERIKQNQIKISYSVQKETFKFRDATKQIWPDSLFVDGSHFNEIGAKKITEFCLNHKK